MRRTIEQIRRQHWHAFRGELTAVRSPAEAQVWLATSNWADDCLTHLVRYVTVYGPRNRPTYHAQCGAMLLNGRPVPVADETFVCGRCITTAEKYGEPTFGMIPTTGCEVSNGKRRGRLTMASKRGVA